MKKSLYALSILSTALVSSCSLLPTVSELVNDQVKYCADDSGDFFECKEITMAENVEVKESKSTLFSTQYNFQFLNEYTEQLAYDLKNSLRNKVVDRNIVVTTFVFLDPSLKNTDSVGQQVAELLTTDLQNNNLPVIDLNLTGYIDINERGEFSLSQDNNDINPNLEIGYICTGTLIENKQGLLINAKIINRTTNRVIASANKTLPRAILSNTRQTSS